MDSIQNWVMIFVSLCNCVSVPIVFATLIVLIRQTWLLQQSNYATAYQVARDILQAQDIREARKHVLGVLKNKPYTDWDDSDKAMAEKVCHTYDSVGQMIRNNLLPKRFIVGHWLAGLNNSRKTLEPFVKDYRERSDYAKHWDDYEYLAREALILYSQES